MARVIVLGAGGHARVVIAALRRAGHQPLGLITPAPLAAPVAGLDRLGGDDLLARPEPEILLAAGIGDGAIRRRLFEQARTRGWRFVTLVDPAAVITERVELGEGAQVIAGAVLQPDCRVGMDSIINSRAVIEHDSVIGAHAHIAPGAVLAGAVTIGDGAMVGAGATVRPGLVIGAGAVVGLGAAVIAAVAPNVVVAGVPARPLRRRPQESDQ